MTKQPPDNPADAGDGATASSFQAAAPRRGAPALRLSLMVGLLVAALLGLPLSVGIWLPDVMGAPERTLAERQTSSGQTVRVVQYWNHVDFYSTELRVISPNGSTETQTLDGDDGKTWSVPLVVDEGSKSATITLRGGRVKRVYWSR